MANSTNHDQEDLLDGIQTVEINIESQINALTNALHALSVRRKLLVDNLAPLPDNDEADQGTVDAIAQLQTDMTDFDTLVPSLPE